MVKVKVTVPDEIIAFLKAMNADIKEYLEETIIQGFAGDLDAFLGDAEIFIFSDEPPLLELLRRLKEIPNLEVERLKDI